jgi:hypothetical protein
MRDLGAFPEEEEIQDYRQSGYNEYENGIYRVPKWTFRYERRGRMGEF